MHIYFSPLSCSLATRIALHESGDTAEFHEVDRKSKWIAADNSDYRKIYPLGMVPSLRTDDGEFLTENAAILQYVADRRPEAGLAPRDPIGRARLQQWLAFIGAELHKGLFIPLLDKTAPAEAKAYALSKYSSRLDYLESHLDGREFLLDRFTVADAYLTTILNWTQVVPEIGLDRYPAVAAYLDRNRKRPSVARAMAEEARLWRAELERNAAAA
jgi:glutathione S-transferase